MGSSIVHRRSWDREWDVHHLTFSTFRSQPFFPGRHAGEWFLEALRQARQRCPFHLFAYVLMPEHVHLTLQPGAGVTMQRVLWHLKQPVTMAALAWTRQHQPGFLARLADVRPSGRTIYRFWLRGGGYDRNMRSGNETHEKIGYIHRNPVRRGLVERPEDWAWSSAADWVLGRVGPVPIDWDYLPEGRLKRIKARRQRTGE